MKSLPLFLTFLFLKIYYVKSQCDEFFEFYKASLDGDLKIIIPKEEVQSNTFKLSISFGFPDTLKSENEIPDITRTESSSVLRQNIDDEEPVAFRIKFKRRNNIPKIGNVLIGETVICEDNEVLEQSSELRGKRKSFKLPRPKKPVKTSSSSDIQDRFGENEVCGNWKFISGFIQGGKRQNQKKWPWVAAMYIDNEYACSVTLISRTRAVTAAHCLQSNPEPSDLTLRIFTNKIISVEAYKKHPNYKKIPKYDIAYLDVKKIEDKMFVPICTTDDQSSVVGDFGKILSFAPNNGDEEEELLSTDLNVLKNDYCEKDLNVNMPSHAFCVSQGKDTGYLCSGDSGSGFLILDENRRYVLRGIVSTGLTDLNGDCSVGDKVIFTNVAYFHSFISEEA